MRIIDTLDLLLKYGSLPIAIIVGLWTWYKFSKQQSFNKDMQRQKSELEKDIKYYEQRLTLLTEQVKFEHAKRNEDFKLWTIKRHEAYADIHETLTKLYSMLVGLQFFIWGPIEISMIHSEWDLISISERLGIDKNTSDKIATTWKIDENQAKEMLVILMQKDREEKLTEVTTAINNKTFQWSLYLPIDMKNNLLDFYSESIDLLFDNELWRKGNGEIERKLKEIVNRCTIIMNEMVADLSGEVDN